MEAKDKESPASALARARSDLIGMALEVVARAMVGQLDSAKLNGRDAELQLKAAQMVLAGSFLANLSDETLMAEMERRAKAKEAAKKNG